jgi:aminoglycoside phosphotransferase (APT) family kinase protein
MAIYTADFYLEEASFCEILKSQAPDIHIGSIQKIGEGWDNIIYQVNEDLIFRVPRRESTVELLTKELNVLPVIADKLPTPISTPFCSLQDTAIFPHAILGYHKIIGDEACRVALTIPEYQVMAKQLGHFLRKLHDMDAQELQLTQYLQTSFRIDKEFLIKRVLPRWHDLPDQVIKRQYDDLVNHIIDEVRSYKFNFEESCILHGDLHARHLIVHNGELNGIIDWGDLSYSHYAVDLMILYQLFPLETHQYFFESYGNIPDEYLKYARFLALLMAITFLWYGYDTRHDVSVASAKQTLSFLQLSID